MCARRFLIMIFFMTLLVVAGAFAIFQFGGDVLLKQATPKGHFEAAKAGSGPDYSLDSSWFETKAAEWQPPVAAGTKDAAVFYVHPTTYLDRDRWNAPLQPGGETELRTTLFLQSQASAFADAGEVWAPRYRQAAYGAFLLDSPDATAALDLAYRDVAAGFDKFVAENQGKPLILAGHSQGALHLERLLQERVAGKPIAKRIVAAYVVGWPIDSVADLSGLGLPACSAPAQTGCILSWMSFAAPANSKLILGRWRNEPGLTGRERESDRLLCVNPVSGTVNGSSAPAANPGTLVPSGDLRSGSLEPGKVGAHCDKGLLLIDGEIPALGPYVLPGNNYHVYDYALFWEAIREDARRRLAKWHR